MFFEPRGEAKNRAGSRAEVGEHTEGRCIGLYAIIKTGGKQYKVSEGDSIVIEKLDVEEGATVEFDEVLTVRTSRLVVRSSKARKSARRSRRTARVRKSASSNTSRRRITVVGRGIASRLLE